MLQKKDVISLFQNEYSALLSKFEIFDLSIAEANNSHSHEVNSPGVYVHWHPQYGVVKIGKSQANSKKRSLEHLTEPTSNDKINMADLVDDVDARILLFNIRSDKDLHWILGLEAFMEWNANPVINAKRIG